MISFVSECSSTNYISSTGKADQNYSSINYLGKRNSSKIFLLDKTVIECDYLLVKTDSLFYGENDLSLTGIPLNEINKVIIRDNAAKFFGAFWAALGTGLATALVTFWATNNSGESGFLPLFTAIITTPLGFITGLMLSGEREFVFNELRQP